MKKIYLGIIGMTKFGKSTILSLLTQNLTQINSSHLDNQGRTKVTIEYHFSNNVEDDIKIEKIIFSHQACGAFLEDVDSFNCFLDKNYLLMNVLGFRKLSKGDFVNVSVNEFLSSYQISSISLDEIVNRNGMDKYIKRIIVSVPPTEILRRFLDEKKIDLYIRDTKGLLDISQSSDESSIYESLEACGLDNLDGIIFCCSETYPNVVAKMYKKFLQDIFKSVPVFLLAKDKHLFNFYSMVFQSISEENVDYFINLLQARDFPVYSNMSDMYFYDTYKLFRSLEIMQKEENEFVFSCQYFPNRDTEFLLPFCCSLKTFETTSSNTSCEELTLKDDFRFFQLITILTITKIIKKVDTLHHEMQKILQHGIAKKYFLEASQKLISEEELIKDFNKYDNAAQSYNTPYYSNPQFNQLSKATIQNNIKNTSIPLLGKNNGITTRSDGIFKYPTTLVVAVTARRWIEKIISCVEVTKDISQSTENDEILFEHLQGNYALQSKLLKHALHYYLYSHFTDFDATIYTYMFVNRFQAKKGIERYRNEFPQSENAFIKTIDNIVNQFADELDTIDIINNLRN